MGKIKTILIGTGHDHAQFNYEGAVSTGRFDIVGYVAIDEDQHKTELFERDYGLKRMTLSEAFAVGGLEAAIVETHDLFLVKYAQMALDKGLHVFMDKPGSQSCEDFERMLSTVKKQNKVFAIGYMYRYNSEIINALKLKNEGKLGEIFSVEAQMNCDHKIDKRKWLKDFKGGMTFFLGCHLVDLIYSFAGMPEEIIPFNTSTGICNVDSEDFGVVVFRYKNGVSFLKTTACEVGGFMRRQVVISGSKGKVEIRPIERNEGNGFVSADSIICLKESEINGSPWGLEGIRHTSNTFPRYALMLDDFANRIEKGFVSSDEELKREAIVHRLLLASCGIECDYKANIDI